MMFLHVTIYSFDGAQGNWVEIGIAYIDAWNPPFEIYPTKSFATELKGGRCEVFRGRRFMIIPTSAVKIALQVNG